MARNLIMAGSHPVLLTNETEIPFITSDQPVINTFAEIITTEKRKLKYDELEFYYPLSPKRAVIQTEKKIYHGIDKRNVSTEEVKKYNQMIYSEADRFVYASDKAMLEECE